MITLPEIQRVVAEVALENGASKALIFGSFARGTATPRSDVDVMFVQQTAIPFLKRLGRFYDALVDRLNRSVEVFVYTPEEVNSMAALPFMRRILSEGVVAYER